MVQSLLEYTLNHHQGITLWDTISLPCFNFSFLHMWGFYIFFCFKIFIYTILERGEGREKERKRNINVWLPLTRSLLGTWPATQACALTGIQTCDPLVCKSALSPLSHTSRVRILFSVKSLCKVLQPVLCEVVPSFSKCFAALYLQVGLLINSRHFWKLIEIIII